jgi:ABC-type multidrug transport system permease subunit
VERSAGEFDGLVSGREADNAQNPAADAAGVDAPRVDKEELTAPGTAPITPATGHPDDENDNDATLGAAPALPVPSAYHIGIEEHDLRVTNVDFLHYQVLPVLILLVLSVGLIGTAMLCAADTERGTARLLTISPVSAWALVAGRMFGGTIVSLAVLAVAIIFCIAFHAISPPIDHWPALIFLFGCTALCASGMGAALGAILQGQRIVAMASSILAAYLFFLGGGFTTIAFLPAWLQHISLLNPIRYAIDGMRQALFYPDLRGVATDLAVLIGTAIGAVLVGSGVVVRSWRNGPVSA